LAPFYARQGFRQVDEPELMPPALRKGARLAARLGLDMAVMLWAGDDVDWAEDDRAAAHP